MDIFRFCPSCGEKSLQWDGEKKWTCPCGFVLYNNVAAAVAVLIKHKDEVFFTRRNQDPKMGKLDLAGGFVDPGESAESACARELGEELGLSVDTTKLKYLASQPNDYHFKGVDYRTLDLFYLYEADEKFTVRMERSEISETLWLKVQEIDFRMLAFDSQRKFLETYVAGL